jgi:hypothetical protein
MRVSRTRAAAEPVAIPAIVPLARCFSGVIEGGGAFVEESWAVGGGLFAELDVSVDVGLVLDVDVGVWVVDGRVDSVVGREVG